MLPLPVFRNYFIYQIHNHVDIRGCHIPTSFFQYKYPTLVGRFTKDEEP